LICSCLESKFEGLPCRHEFSILIKQTIPITYLNIQPRWKKDFFIPEELPIDDENEEEDFEDEELNNVENVRIEIREEEHK